MKFNKNTLIEYRISRAKETIKGAELALKNNMLFDAENRIYYAIFFIVTALALKNDFSASKHSQLLGLFNHNFIKNNILDVDLGRIYRNALKYRKKGDYDDFAFFEKAEVEEHFKDMLYFVSEIEKFINSPNEFCSK